MIVAVLDDGICRDEMTTEITTYFAGRMKGKKFIQKNVGSHGTVCAKIIEEYAAPDKIIDIVFTDEEGYAEIEDLIDAFRVCLEIEVDCINMSNGIEEYNIYSSEYKELLNVCKELYYKGVKIFAAQSNDGNQAIPAYFPYTVSVERFRIFDSVMRMPYRRSDIYTFGSFKITIGWRKRKVIKCNSFACPYALSLSATGSKSLKIWNSKLISSDVTLYKQVFYNKKNIMLFDSNNKKNGSVYLDNVSFLQKRKLNKNNLNFLTLEPAWLLKRFIAWKSKKEKKCDIPIIYINIGKKGISTALRLYRYFKNEKYNTAVLSEYKSHFLKGAYYLPKSLMHQYINYFSHQTNNDIIFVIVKDVKITDEDMCIVKINGKIGINSHNGVKEVGDFSELTDEIIKFYS